MRLNQIFAVLLVSVLLALAGCAEDAKVKQNTTPLPAPAAGEVFITELMLDPNSTADADGEWIEVYNGSTSAVSLAGCSLSDLGTDNITISGPEIAAGAHAVLAVSNLAANGNVDYVWGLDGSFQLANGGDEFILTCGGVLIDQYATPAIPAPVGKTVQLSSATYDATSNDNSANWCPATVNQGDGDLGTPGVTNGVC